ncbi:chymotrypsinogen B-like [Oppia nitens]|uniref:chymotrypsinogen B-like n=1 Tax=Oppia nitens TaxID=1686743 RepID=UPI0023DBCAD9|nr:chymotrypsinogen B-like [Oppia nitens]
MTGQCLRWSSNIITSSVQNGRLAKPGEWPWIVSILLQKYFLYFIPTKSKRSEYTITVSTVQDQRHTYDVDKRIVHHNFHRDDTDRPNARYDIALLKLVLPIPIPTIPIALSGGQFQQQTNGICLPDKDIVNTVEELALTAGFGDIDDEVDNYDQQLLMGWLKLVKTVNTSYDKWGYWIRAYRYPPNTGTALCMGDSGGPLVQYVDGGRAVLIGLNSLQCFL